jgi:hypothetical protein
MDYESTLEKARNLVAEVRDDHSTNEENRRKLDFACLYIAQVQTIVPPISIKNGVAVGDFIDKWRVKFLNDIQPALDEMPLTEKVKKEIQKTKDQYGNIEKQWLFKHEQKRRVSDGGGFIFENIRLLIFVRSQMCVQFASPTSIEETKLYGLHGLFIMRNEQGYIKDKEDAVNNIVDRACTAVREVLSKTDESIFRTAFPLYVTPVPPFRLCVQQDTPWKIFVRDSLFQVSDWITLF